MSHYQFHQLHQSPSQSFDLFVKLIKNEAKNCNIICENNTCSYYEVPINLWVEIVLMQ